MELFKNKKSPSVRRLRIYHLPIRSLNSKPYGRSSDLRIVLLSAPSHFVLQIFRHETVVIADFVPDHSGGSVPESNRFPNSKFEYTIKLSKLLCLNVINQIFCQAHLYLLSFHLSDAVKIVCMPIETSTQKPVLIISLNINCF